MHLKNYKNNKTHRNSITHASKLIIIFIITIFLLLPVIKTNAQSVDELQAQIEERRKIQEQLDKEVAEQKEKLKVVSQQKNTLQNTVNSLTSTEKKIGNDIKATENKIGTSAITLEKLDLEIDGKLTSLEKNSIALAASIRAVDELESTSFIEKILVFKNFSEFFNTLHSLEQFTNDVHNTVTALKILNDELENKYKQTESEKKKLEGLKTELAGEKQAVVYTKKEKEQVLAVTKNTEAEYQKILKEKEEARAQIASDLNSLETKLQYVLDPSTLPSRGSKALKYPLEVPSITQGFGLTPFALAGSYGYTNGQPNPHRGIDFRASIGTKLLSSANGVVRQSYNMDAVPGCYSYGQWILIDHDNGLSTLSAHLSVRSVTSGQIVKAGDVIGYTGKSGYATGPHLHFSVFPKDAVKVDQFSNSIGCKNALVPIAAKNAYLNPLDYF